jgi:Na+-transporting methylmalonyl-CoA/oxaloacetate decarboxylase gamma subunit
MDNFPEALRIAGIGMGVVFLGLILLTLLLMALNRLIPAGTPTPAEEDAGEEIPSGEADSATTLEVTAEEAAAIAAAVQASGGFGDEPPAGRGGGASSGWRLQGRGRLMASRGVRRRGGRS